MSQERLQKILSRAGVSSRRKAEDLIASGRVRVDGRIVTELGARADPRIAKVELDGRRLVAESLIYLVLHKPRGVVSTLRDPEGRTSISELVRGLKARVFPVGRLDYNTSGAILLTNDGEFAGVLGHPRGGAPKVYVAKVRGGVDDAVLERLRRQIVVQGRMTRPADVVRLRVERDKTWLRITLKEGRNRQVHRLCEAAGLRVMRLVRLSQAGIGSEGLLPGQWRHLTLSELAELQKAYGVPRRVRAAELGEAGRIGGRLHAAHGAPGRRQPRPSGARKPQRSQRPHPHPARVEGRDGVARERFSRAHARDHVPSGRARDLDPGHGRDRGRGGGWRPRGTR